MGKLLGNTIDYKIAFGQLFQAIRRSLEKKCLIQTDTLWANVPVGWV
jgi:hypothetical protein